MIPILLAAGIAASPVSTATALDLCRPRLARRVDGDISSISADKVTRRGSTTIIKGPMRALIGMGAPAPGMASAHHLIRQDYTFTCSIRAGRVRSVNVESQQR